MSPVKRSCVFEHSVMTNFNCACPDIQRGQGSGFLYEGSSWLNACMSEQRRFWRDCADAQARLNLRCSHRRLVPNSLDAVHMSLSVQISIWIISLAAAITDITILIPSAVPNKLDYDKQCRPRSGSSPFAFIPYFLKKERKVNLINQTLVQFASPDEILDQPQKETIFTSEFLPFLLWHQ